MNHLNQITLSVAFALVLPHLAIADDTQSEEYMVKWAAFTGYNLNNDAPTTPVSTLLNVTNTALAQQYSLFTLFGALTVNAFNTNFSSFAPADSTYGKLLNPYANSTFSNKYTHYQTPSSTTSIAVSPLIDQQTYPQADPVSQFITNLLTTPNISYCLNNDGTAWLTDCKYLYDSLIKYNVIGDSLPGPTAYFDYAYNQAIIPQLNSATLLSPLLYSTSSSETQSGSSSSTATATGLTASNQLQEATNYIRYLSSALIKPFEAAHFSDYNDAYTTATDPTASITNITNAQNSIIDYIADLRTYAAKMSISMNNIYGMLSSRMPQAQSDGTTTSSALSMFQLATRRLSDPSLTSTNQWINQINQASDATVNKEIATTLADILYMMYVLHQDNERQLLTNSAILMSFAHSPSFQAPSLVGDNNTPPNTFTAPSVQ